MSCPDCATAFDQGWLAVEERYADLLAAAEGVMGDEPDLSHCPYFKGTGQCSSGCSSEPSCQTDRPLNGWPKERLAAAIKKAKGQ